MTLRILLVEDNPVNRELVVDLLEVEGHAVDIAIDGASFRRYMSMGIEPDLVLMDISLPDASGVELQQEFRRERPTSSLPIVAITAHALTAEIDRLRASGFEHVMTKPIDTRTFAERVAALARRGD